jgi:hypothetical protein
LEMLPVADDPTHWTVGCKRKKRMQMIGHQHKEPNVPTLRRLIKVC